MSAYSTSCPGCGAPVSFSLGQTLLTVCEHCNSAVARVGADVENYGKVAELIPTNSVLKLGLEGRDETHGAFRILGHLQLDSGNGTWDEWALVFSDESEGWLAEAQGRFYITREVLAPPLASFSEHDPGETVDLGEKGLFAITEVHSAKFGAAEGELPFAVAVGATLNFVDVSGPKGAFGTLDYGAGEQIEAVYVGRELKLSQLGFSPSDLPDADERSVEASSKTVSCPQCAGTLELRVPDETQRIGCPYCGSLLDATGDLKILTAQARLTVKPLIPLSRVGKLKGVPWTVIGHLVREVRVDGVSYPWEEYLLHEPGRGFRWLTCSSGHWAFVEPIEAGSVQSGQDRPTHDGRSYKHFQSGQAKVVQVIGEFYWKVKKGEAAATDDYVSPPFMLSRERTPNELSWSRGEYVEGEEVWKAFKLKGRPPSTQGVAPCQVNSAAATGKEALGIAGLMTVLLVFFAFVLTGMSDTYPEEHLTAVAQPRQGERPSDDAMQVLFSKPFDVKRQSRVRVRVRANVDNSWSYFEGALINETLGEIRPFTAEAAYYHGRSGGESWSEGKKTATARIGSVTPGRYLMRLTGFSEHGKGDRNCAVEIRVGGARASHFFLALSALFAWPLLCGIMWYSIESRRWSESDHPWNSE